jgi:uncharacterized integral membrane protein
MKRSSSDNRNLLQTLWISRRIVGAALLVGTLLWFIVTNNQGVTVHLPFGLGHPSASVGIVVLVSAIIGSIATVLIMTLVWAWRRYRHSPKSSRESLQKIPDERPPANYATGATEGFSDASWAAR